MSALHPIFDDIIGSHMRATEVVTPKRDEHRGWAISFDYPPIPSRDFDWSATHPDYDCDCDQDGFFATSGAVVHASTREGVIAEIDAWHEENGL